MTKPPDRVVIISDFSQAKGGASKLALLLAERLAESGQPVTFFAGDKLVEAVRGVDHVNLGADALLAAGPVRAALGGIWNGPAKTRLADWVATNDSPGTIYHMHGFMQTLSPSVFAALHTVRHRTVVHAHDYFLACPNGGFFDYQKSQTCARVPMSFSCVTTNCDKRNYPQKLWRVARQSALDANQAAFRKDAVFVLLHDRMAEYLDRRTPAKRTKTIANPADAFLTTPVAAEKNDWFCYVGDMHNFKGVHLFAEAARRANVLAHFIGDGQDAQMLKTDYPEAVFHGWQNRDGLKDLLKNARAVVVPSRGPEPFGLTCVEAMLSGIPVIVSDSILLSQGIEEHGGGISFKAGDVPSLEVALSAIACDDGHVAKLSRSGPNAARMLATSPQDWTDQIVDVYHDVLSQAQISATTQQQTNASPARAV